MYYSSALVKFNLFMGVNFWQDADWSNAALSVVTCLPAV